jgi:diguanylate cyclase (GGDEF)-like protein/PAS domain S-box-containing protein
MSPLIKRLLQLILMAMLAMNAASLDARQVDPAQSRITRHPLETRALVDPEGVLKELPGLIKHAETSKNYKELGLLYLAQSNACRVIADWPCQSLAGANARKAATLAGLPELQIRGLIADARARIALQDFKLGEDLLGEAERILKLHPFPELAADVFLAYSSLSNTLGKNSLAVEYAEHGLKELSNLPSLPIRVRLMRNQARGLAQMGESIKAESILKQAIGFVEKMKDPKLSAELYLEVARSARLNGNVLTQQENGQKILALADQLSNSQLKGLGHEVLGLAEIDKKQSALAEIELQLAIKSFNELGQYQDERRVLRVLVKSMLGRNRPQAEMDRLTSRLIQLEALLGETDRKLAADDFGTRLKYAQQNFDLKELETTNTLIAEREASANSERRFITIVAILSILLFIAMVILSITQRRFSTRLKQAITQLKESENRMRAITDNTPALIAQLDNNQRYLFANGYFKRIFGIDPKDLIGRTMREIRGEKVYADIEPHVQNVLRGKADSFEGSSMVGEQQFHYQSNYVPDLDSNGRVNGFYALTFDITAQKNAEEKLDKLARIDSLTGVANRRHFEERLSAMLAHSKRHHEAIALLYLDIDHFKSINDQYGHAIGDLVIKIFVERLSACVRQDDLVARLGGDEFVILIQSPERDSGETIAKKLLAAMQEPMHIEGQLLQVSASIGVAYSATTPTSEALLQLADQALYAAKDAGRNTYKAQET